MLGVAARKGDKQDAEPVLLPRFSRINPCQGKRDGLFNVALTLFILKYEEKSSKEY